MNAYMWNLENGTDEPICKAGIDTDVKNRHVDTDGERKGGTKWESTGIYRLLYVK